MDHEPEDPIVQNRAIMARARELAAELQNVAASLDVVLQKIDEETRPHD